MELYSLSVFRNRRLRKIFGHKRKKQIDRRRRQNANFMKCTTHQYRSGDTTKKEMDRPGGKFEREDKYIMEFSEKTRGKRYIGRIRRKLENIFKVGI
jgi:hypothetical protein